MKGNAGESVHTRGKESQQVPAGEARQQKGVHSPIVLFWAASGTVVVSEVPALPWLRMIPLSVSNCSSSCVTMPLVLYLMTESDTWSHHTHTQHHNRCSLPLSLQMIEGPQIGRSGQEGEKERGVQRKQLEGRKAHKKVYFFSCHNCLSTTKILTALFFSFFF